MPSPTFTFSTLTPGEVWRAAWDDATQTLKTALWAQIVGVQQEVKIDAADDSVVAFQPNGASLRVFVDNFASLTINVTAGSTVTVANGVTVFQGTNPWVVGGTVTVANPSAAGQTVTISNDSLGVTFGTITASVNNFPAVQSVTLPIGITVFQGTNPWPVAGSVSATATVANTVTIAQGSSLSVLVGNFPSSQGVTFGVVGVTFPIVAVQSVTLPIGLTTYQGTNPWGVTFGAAGTITQAAILVGVTAVRLTVSGAAPSASRTTLIGEPDPNSSANFWVGSSSVGNTGTPRGIPLEPGERFIANNDSGDYFIVSDGVTQTVFVLEKG